MVPRLFESTATAFTSLGICPLPDAVSCLVTEERNDQYTLEMVYPIDGFGFNEIKVDRIILALAHDGDSHAQPFRIESIHGDIGATVTVNAVHISYQLNWIICEKFASSSGTDSPTRFWNGCNNHVISTSQPFDFNTDYTGDYSGSHNFGAPEATPFRTLLGGMENSMLDIWHGEFEWDLWDVNFWQNRGADNGVYISYGKNLTGIDWDTDVSETYTGVVAFWKQEDAYVEGSIQHVGGSFAFERTIVLDASDHWQSQPTTTQLNNYAASYVKANAINPVVSCAINFVPLWQTEEYKDFADLEKVNLCDTVHIVYPPLELELTAKVVKTVFNVLLERYDSIQISTAKKNLANTIFAMQKEIEKKK